MDSCTLYTELFLNTSSWIATVVCVLESFFYWQYFTKQILWNSHRIDSHQYKNVIFLQLAKKYFSTPKALRSIFLSSFQQKRVDTQYKRHHCWQSLQEKLPSCEKKGREGLRVLAPHSPHVAQLLTPVSITVHCRRDICH